MCKVLGVGSGCLRRFSVVSAVGAWPVSRGGVLSASRIGERISLPRLEPTVRTRAAATRVTASRRSALESDSKPGGRREVGATPHARIDLRLPSAILGRLGGPHEDRTCGLLISASARTDGSNPGGGNMLEYQKRGAARIELRLPASILARLAEVG